MFLEDSKCGLEPALQGHGCAADCTELIVV